MYSAIDKSIFLSIAIGKVTSSSGEMETGPLARIVCWDLLSAMLSISPRKKGALLVFLQIVSPSRMDSIGRVHSAFPEANVLVKERVSA